MLFKGDTLDSSRTEQAAKKETFSLGFSYEVVPKKTHLLKLVPALGGFREGNGS